eukprot:14017184-Heterocapsa_arctica.AAC.1
MRPACSRKGTGGTARCGPAKGRRPPAASGAIRRTTTSSGRRCSFSSARRSSRSVRKPRLCEGT